MFNFLKSNPFLKDVLPPNYLDIHNHLLPGIDDGSPDLPTTNALIKGMKSLGITQAVTTPHTFFERFDNTSESIHQAFDQVKKQANHPEFIRNPASEYMLDLHLLDRANKERLLCIKDNFLLVELNLFNWPINLYELLFELKIKDYQIIIAHPERYTYFHNSIKKFEKLKEFGVEFQMNLLSLAGYYNNDVLKCTKELLERDLYTFTGTDIHHAQHIEFLQKKPLLFKQENQLIQLLENNAQL